MQSTGKSARLYKETEEEHFHYCTQPSLSVVFISAFFSILCRFLHKGAYYSIFSCFPFYSSGVIVSQRGGGQCSVIVETYSFVWKGIKENQECTNGDYSLQSRIFHVMYYYSQPYFKITCLFSRFWKKNWKCKKPISDLHSFTTILLLPPPFINAVC